MNKDAMNEALKRRKLNALDITILLGDGAGVAPSAELADSDVSESAEKEQDEELDLAPKGTEVGEMTDEEDLAASHGDVAQDKLLIEQELAKHGVGRGTMLQRNMKKARPLSSTEV